MRKNTTLAEPSLTRDSPSISVFSFSDAPHCRRGRPPPQHRQLRALLAHYPQRRQDEEPHGPRRQHTPCDDGFLCAAGPVMWDPCYDVTTRRCPCNVLNAGPQCRGTVEKDCTAEWGSHATDSPRLGTQTMQQSCRVNALVGLALYASMLVAMLVMSSRLKFMVLIALNGIRHLSIPRSNHAHQSLPVDNSQRSKVRLGREERTDGHVGAATQTPL